MTAELWLQSKSSKSLELVDQVSRGKLLCSLRPKTEDAQPL